MLQVLDSLAREPKQWFFASVGPLVTQQREYVALHRVAASGVSGTRNPAKFIVCVMINGRLAGVTNMQNAHI